MYKMFFLKDVKSVMSFKILNDFTFYICYVIEDLLNLDLAKKKKKNGDKFMLLDAF